jgi:hypothetical protein
MKIYRLDGNDFDTRYARAVLADDPEPFKECPRCHRILPQPRDRLEIAWKVGRNENPLNEIGDFTWPCGLQFIVVQNDTRTRITEALPDAKFKDVKVVGITQGDSGIVRAADDTMAPLLEGLPLWWLTANHILHLDIRESGRIPQNCCSECSRCDWTVAANAQIVIPRSELKDATIFRVHEVGAPLFIVEPAAMLLKSHGISNLQIKEAGLVT